MVLLVGTDAHDDRTNSMAEVPCEVEGVRVIPTTLACLVSKRILGMRLELSSVAAPPLLQQVFLQQAGVGKSGRRVWGSEVDRLSRVFSPRTLRLHR